MIPKHLHDSRGTQLVHGLKYLLRLRHDAQKPLIEPNSYLKAPEKYRQDLITNVSSSIAIETGVPVEEIARILTQTGKAETVKKPKGSGQ